MSMTLRRAALSLLLAPPEGPLGKSRLLKHPYANILNNPKPPTAADPANTDAEGPTTRKTWMWSRFRRLCARIRGSM